MSSRQRSWAVLVSVSAMLLFVFAVYARAVALMPFHDDAVLMPAISNRTLLTIFENRPYGDGHHRPMSYLPWLLTRDLFGWFSAPVLHWWNVAAHVLNTALVASLAARLGRRLGVRTVVLPVASGLAFGLAPLSYEAVLWASALVHPWMAMFGLFALHAWLRVSPPPFHGGGRVEARVGSAILCALLLLAACLSHEMGFVFGALVLLIEVFLAAIDRRKLNWVALALCGLTFTYALAYRFVLITKWTDPASRDYARDPAEILANLAYQAQNFDIGALTLFGSALRGLYAQPLPLVVGLFAVSLVIGWVVLWRKRRLAFGALAFAMWLVLIGPSSLLLTQDYVWSSPRMTYVPSIAAALFWGGVIANFFTSRRGWASEWGSAALLIPLAAILINHAQFISLRLTEALRLTPALKQIDAALQSSSESDAVLLINSSFINLAAQPTYPIGKEGLPVWEYGYIQMDGPLWAWPAAVSGTVRETRNVRHAASLTGRDPSATGDYDFTDTVPFRYGIFGEAVGDAALRQRILQSNIVFRFDYDAPGFRATPLAIIKPARDEAASTTLSLGDAQIDVSNASAFRCGGRVYLDVIWKGVRGLSKPTAVFVHGHAGEHQVVVADRDPIGGYLPLDQFPANTAIAERREIGDAVGKPPITAVRVGVYDRESGKRFAARRDDGSRWDGDAIVVPVADVAIQSSACP